MTFAFLGTAGAADKAGGPPPMPGRSLPASGGPIEVTADTLAKDYDRDIIGAARKYPEGRPVKVSGKVREVGLVGDSKVPTVQFESDSKMSVRIMFSRDEAGAISGISKGDQLVAVCEHNVPQIDHVILVGCTLER
jgi:hypothetical protein